MLRFHIIFPNLINFTDKNSQSDLFVQYFIKNAYTIPSDSIRLLTARAIKKKASL